MVSAVVTEKQPSCPEACCALLDTSVPAHRVSRRSSCPFSSPRKPQQSLKEGLGDQVCPHKLELSNDMCNQIRLHCGGNSVSLPPVSSHMVGATFICSGPFLARLLWCEAKAKCGDVGRMMLTAGLASSEELSLQLSWRWSRCRVKRVKRAGMRWVAGVLSSCAAQQEHPSWRDSLH